MTKYTIITASDHSELIAKVNTEIEKGWRPTGGVTLLNIHQARPQPAMVLAQAMIRD
jgi:hypothetical protein